MSAFLDNSGQGTCPVTQKKCNKACEKWKTVRFNNGKEVSACTDNWTAFFLENIFNIDMKEHIENEKERMKKEGKKKDGNILIPTLQGNIKMG